MRYQRLSPDCFPLSKATRPNSRMCKKDDSNNGGVSVCNGFDSLVPDSFRPIHLSAVKHENGSVGDVLLQWGQRKRSRGFRTESRGATTEFVSSEDKQVAKIHRKVVSGAKKKAANQPISALIAPRAFPVASTSGSHHRRRNLDERLVPASGSKVGKATAHIHSQSSERSVQPREKMDKISPAAAVIDGKPIGGITLKGEPLNVEYVSQPESEPIAALEKRNLNSLEWPRIYIGLSRKEKEDDFLVIKGTKLPQRPKKRAKNVDKMLQYCFPGMWLSDLTRSRYEVREKKCAKKRPRGLKGLESMESDSE